MSSQPRISLSVLFLALTLSPFAHAESYSADLTSAKILGASLRAYTTAYPENQDLIKSNIIWTQARIAETKKFVGNKNLSKEMKLKTAADSYTLLMDALVKIAPTISDKDAKNAARDRLLSFKKVVDTKNISDIYNMLSAMELEMSSVIKAYNPI